MQSEAAHFLLAFIMPWLDQVLCKYLQKNSFLGQCWKTFGGQKYNPSVTFVKDKTFIKENEQLIMHACYGTELHAAILYH
jgi:hypothetical protein